LGSQGSHGNTMMKGSRFLMIVIASPSSEMRDA